MSTTRVNTTRARRRLNGVRTSLPKMARNAINDTVRDVSRMTPDILRGKIDKPTPYTLRKSVGLYDRTNEQQLRGRIFMGPQKEYLSKLEFGGVEGNEQIPAEADSYDRYGNLLRRFRISRGSLSTALLNRKVKGRGGRHKVGRFFIGKARGRGVAGLYERLPGNEGLEMRSIFSKRRRVRASLGLRDEWRDRAEDLLPRHFNEQKRRNLRRL